MRLHKRLPWYSSTLNALITDTANSAYGNQLNAEAVMENQLGQKQYELVSHLGNVHATVSDKRGSVANTVGLVQRYLPAMQAAYDYYAFGTPPHWRGVVPIMVPPKKAGPVKYVEHNGGKSGFGKGFRVGNSCNRLFDAQGKPKEK